MRHRSTTSVVVCEDVFTAASNVEEEMDRLSLDNPTYKRTRTPGELRPS